MPWLGRGQHPLAGPLAAAAIAPAASSQPTTMPAQTGRHAPHVRSTAIPLPHFAPSQLSLPTYGGAHPSQVGGCCRCRVGAAEFESAPVGAHGDVVHVELRTECQPYSVQLTSQRSAHPACHCCPNAQPAHRAAAVHQPAASLRVPLRASQLPASQPQGFPWSQVSHAVCFTKAWAPAQASRPGSAGRPPMPAGLPRLLAWHRCTACRPPCLTPPRPACSAPSWTTLWWAPSRCTRRRRSKSWASMLLRWRWAARLLQTTASPAPLGPANLRSAAHLEPQHPLRQVGGLGRARRLAVPIATGKGD